MGIKLWKAQYGAFVYILLSTRSGARANREKAGGPNLVTACMHGRWAKVSRDVGSLRMSKDVLDWDSTLLTLPIPTNMTATVVIAACVGYSSVSCPLVSLQYQLVDHLHLLQLYVEASFHIRLDSFPKQKCFASRWKAFSKVFPAEQLRDALLIVTSMLARSMYNLLSEVRNTPEKVGEITVTVVDEMIARHFLDSTLGDQRRYAGYLLFVTINMLAKTGHGQRRDDELTRAQLCGSPCYPGITTYHILSRFRGALRMMLSTLSRSSAASEAEETTARFSL